MKEDRRTVNSSWAVTMAEVEEDKMNPDYEAVREAVAKALKEELFCTVFSGNDIQIKGIDEAVDRFLKHPQIGIIASEQPELCDSCKNTDRCSTCRIPSDYHPSKLKEAGYLKLVDKA